MNEKFQQFTTNMQSTILRVMKDTDLKALYGLTESEVALGKALVYADDHKSQSANSDKDESKQFSEFLQKEYDNIANAHFNTDTTITRFFQFYLEVRSPDCRVNERMR